MPIDTRPTLIIRGEVINAVSAAYRATEMASSWKNDSVVHEVIQ